MCPETSLKARDKPFGGKVLEIDCLPSVNLFFPWRSHWLPPEPICDIILAKNGIFHKCEGGFVVMRAARGKTWQNKVLWPT